MSTKIGTDDLPYEVVILQKNGLSRRDGLRYNGIRLARRERDRLCKLGHEATVLPWHPINEPAYMREAVA